MAAPTRILAWFNDPFINRVTENDPWQMWVQAIGIAVDDNGFAADPPENYQDPYQLGYADIVVGDETGEAIRAQAETLLNNNLGTSGLPVFFLLEDRGEATPTPAA